MLINPISLIREIEVLSQKGISQNEILTKLFIDKECFLITPYHKLVNVAKEILRKNANHGSTGLGVGVAIDDAMYSDSASLFPKSRVCLKKEKQIEINDRNYAHFNVDCALIKIADFYDRNLIFKKLKKLIEEKTQHVEFLIEEYYLKNQLDKNLCAEDKYIKEVRSTLEKFKFDFSLVKLLKTYVDWFDKFSNHRIFVENSADFIYDFLNKNVAKDQKAWTNIVFEGSQGALLDRIYGFYPHITKTLCSCENAEKLIDELKIKFNFLKIETFKIGVLRVYSSRHGKGPFVTESKFWSENIKELHNDFGRFQGEFKLGPFDLIGAKYGVEIFRPDFLSVTCIDRIVEKIDKKSFITFENNNLKEKSLVVYQEKINDFDFYFCEFYFLDYLKLCNDSNKQSLNKTNVEKNKNDIIRNEQIEEYLEILDELKQKGILEICEFESKEKLEEFLIRKIEYFKNAKINENVQIIKKYIINSNEMEINKYQDNTFSLVLVTNINKGDDYYNFKNENLTKILEYGKPIYYKCCLNQFNLEKVSDEKLINNEENFKFVNFKDQKLSIEKFFNHKLSNYPYYDFNHVYLNLLNLEKEIKIPIKIISLGPTKEDKLFLQKFDS